MLNRIYHLKLPLIPGLPLQFGFTNFPLPLDHGVELLCPHPIFQRN